MTLKKMILKQQLEIKQSYDADVHVVECQWNCRCSADVHVVECHWNCGYGTDVHVVEWVDLSLWYRYKCCGMSLELSLWYRCTCRGMGGTVVMVQMYIWNGSTCRYGTDVYVVEWRRNFSYGSDVHIAECRLHFHC
jgi:hypothetical protein